MKLVLWEDAIDQVDMGRSCHFQFLKVHIFDDAKYVNSNEWSFLSLTDDINSISLTSSELHQNVIETNNCVGIDIKKSLACIACNNVISDSDDQEGRDTIACKTCKITLLKSAMKVKLVCHIGVNSKGKIARDTCFTNAVDSSLA